MFASPYFRALGVKHVRVITAWDSLRHRWSRDAAGQLHERRARRRREGAARLRPRPQREAQGPPPRARACSEFTKEFLKYKKRYPWVKDWLTWNEANHCGEPTCHKARARRALLQQHRHNCYGCNVVGGRRAGHPDDGAVGRGVPQATARNDKMIWGLHNYIDANRFRTTGTKALLKAAPTGRSGSPRPAGWWCAATGRGSPSPATRSTRRRRPSRCSGSPR